MLSLCVNPSVYHNVCYMLHLSSVLTTLLDLSSYTCSAQTEKREVERSMQRGCSTSNIF